MVRRTLLWGMLVVLVFLFSGIVAAWGLNCDTRPLKPDGSVCDDQQNCLVNFAGYSWWTNYMFNLEGQNKGYYFKGQQWDPRLVYADNNGLHLQMKKTTLPNANEQWSSTEVVLYGDGSGPVVQGYGLYLVAVSTKESFDALGRANCTFGAFTYQFNSDSSETNTYHELDMIETGCLGQQCADSNAQFTIQPWDAWKFNVHRITIKKDVRDITVVMEWRGDQNAVTFKVYYGIYDLDHLPSSPDIFWKTNQEQQWRFIPKSDCQPIHLNLWRGDPGKEPPGEQEVIIKKFQYRKAATEAPEGK
ncbi:MAG: hypothetical protein ACLP5H_27780 [Desulfomonilaceae bacterium]